MQRTLSHAAESGRVGIATCVAVTPIILLSRKVGWEMYTTHAQERAAPCCRHTRMRLGVEATFGFLVRAVGDWRCLLGCHCEMGREEVPLFLLQIPGCPGDSSSNCALRPGLETPSAPWSLRLPPSSWVR